MTSMKVIQTAKLGGNAKNVTVLKTGHGLMMMTLRPTPIPDEDAFASIKAGMDSLLPGAKMFLNTGQFYAQDLGGGNLELLARFFEKYPSYTEKAFLSVKGGMKFNTLEPDVSPEGLKRSVDFCVEKLRGTKKIDLFECARVDRSYPFEGQMKVLADLVKEGKFDYIGLSEASAATIREANAVVPIAAVEIEVSPWSYTQETKDAISTCAELGIAVVAYSPLGRGFLTGQIKGPQDLEEGDYRRNFSRFKEENFDRNYAFVAALTAIAEKKGITPAQLCLAWVSSLGPHVISIPGSSNYKRTLENIIGGDIVLSNEEIAEIDKVLKTHTVERHRMRDDVPSSALRLWG